MNSHTWRKVFPAVTLTEWRNDTVAQQSRKAQLNYRWGRGHFSGHFCWAVPAVPPPKHSFFRKAPLTVKLPKSHSSDLIRFSFLPDKTVNFRASWAIMFTKPFSRESKALPSSIKYLDSQARQYCSLECNMLLHGAVKLPGKGAKMEFMFGENTMADSWQEEPKRGSEQSLQDTGIFWQCY